MNPSEIDLAARVVGELALEAQQPIAVVDDEIVGR
jgi:hypothetical protein